MSTSIYDRQLFDIDLISGSLVTAALNASGLKIAAKIRGIGKQITAIGVGAGSVTAPPVYQVSLQGGSAGVPSGTILGGGSPASATFTPAGSTLTLVTLANPYTPAVGDDLFIVLEYSSGTIGAGNFANFNYRVASYQPWADPAPLTFNGTTWSVTSTSLPLLTVQYADGSYAYLNPFASLLSSAINYNGSSSPNEYGISFVAEAGMTIDGVDVLTDLVNTSATGAIGFYDSGNSSLTGSDNTGLDGSKVVVVNGQDYFRVNFTPIALSAGATYYCTLKGTNAGNNVRIVKHTFKDAASLAAAMGYGASFVSRTGAGAWTSDPASMAVITPLLKAIGSGGAGGSRVIGSSVIVPARKVA